MFAYCENNPVLLTDNYGTFPCNTIMVDSKSGSTISGEELARIIRLYRAQHDVVYSDRELIEMLANSTKISQKTVNVNGEEYLTFYAHVKADDFLNLSLRNDDLEDTVALYAEYLFARINSMKEPGARYYLMSKSHIYSETMAHLVVWESIYHPSAEIIDLNVNENRTIVKILMYLFGYNGSEVIE